MFRGYCVLVMIEAHVSNATILDSIQKTKTFHYLDLFNGTIAPSFIFIAGFAVALALERKWDDFLKFSKPLWMHLRRLLFVLALGYWLHLPVWSLRTLIARHDISVLNVDVLQLIAVSLFFTILIALIFRNLHRLKWPMLILMLLIIFSTPFVFEADPKRILPVAIAAYFDKASLFPIFPWAAYSFAGTFLSLIYLQIRGTEKERTFFRILCIGGLLMTISAFALFYVPWQYHAYTDMARASPRSFMMRIGAVLFVFSCFYFYEQWRKPAKSILNIAGQQSLMVYAVHLMIVYGTPLMNFNFANAIGRTLRYQQAFALSGGLIALMTIAALLWHGLKSHQPREARAVLYACSILFLLRFFLY